MFLAVLGAGLTARVIWVRRAVGQEAAQQLARTVEGSRPVIEMWRDAYVAQASLIARIAALEPSLSDVAPNEALRRGAATRFSAELGALDPRHGIVGAWMYDASGRVLAGTGDAPPAPATPWGPASVTTGLDAGGVHADVAAPIAARRSEDPPLGTVVLRVRVTDTTFAALNPPRPASMGPSPRTTVFARLGDSVLVVAAAPGSDDPWHARVMPIAIAPVQVRAALEGRLARDVGRGVFASEVAYGTATVKSLGWGMVREQRLDVLYDDLRSPLIVEETIFASLAILLALTIVGVVRGWRARRAAALAELRGDFVSAVSHELRTPLAQIRLFAELLRKGSLRDAAEADRALGVIEKEAGRLSILVDNILSYTSLRRRQRFVTPLAADVANEARQVIESFRPLAAERGAQVVADLEEATRARIDTQALRQVLLNFLENAVKYGPKGQTVTVGARHITAGDGRARVRLWVDDAGPGVPVSERSTVWDAFYRTERAQRSGVGGSGLGLAVVRDLVAQYGGIVGVEDSPTGGARFVVELPGLRLS